MERFVVYIELEDYLKQWFINEMGGDMPVKLIRGSVESKILEVFLTKRPEDLAPDLGGEDKLPIIIPEFRNRPADVYNHLPKHAVTSLQNIIRHRFDISLWKDLNTFGNIIGNRQDDLIYAWMEKHGIEINEKNWNAIAKRYQRQRMCYANRERARKNYFCKK